MSKPNRTQLYFMILTLIAGACYLLFTQEGSRLPGLNLPSKQEQKINDSISNPDSDSKSDTTSSLKIRQWQTANNIPVYFVEANELPMFDVSVTFRAGAAYSADKPGLAALTNEMLVEGTSKYNTEQISEKLEAIGAEYSAGVDKDSASVSLRSLTEQSKLNTALEIYTDIIANANFPNKSFTRVKNNTIRSLKLSKQYPETVLNESFYKNIYKTHPYSVPVDGSIDTVTKINRSDLVRFYKDYYVNSNAMISMVGKLNLAQAKKVAEDISKAIKPGVAASSLPNAVVLSASIKQHIDFPATQTHILIGSVGIKRDDPDYFSLKVGNHILGSMPLSSLLFKDIRIKKGLAYSVYSSFLPMQDRGPFIINMQTRNEKADEALTTTIRTLTRFVNNGPTAEQLQLAKQNLTGRFPLSISSNGKKLGVISSIGFYNLPLDYLDTYIDNINKVTIDDIKTAFNKNIKLNKMAIVTVGGKSNAAKEIGGKLEDVQGGGSTKTNS